MNHGDFYSTE